MSCVQQAASMYASPHERHASRLVLYSRSYALPNDAHSPAEPQKGCQELLHQLSSALQQCQTRPKQLCVLQIYFANEVERRFGSQGLHATSVHPGGIFTNLPRHLDPETVKGMMTPAMETVIKSPEQGAATTVWAAIGKEWEGKGGKYLEDCGVSKPFEADAPDSKGLGPLAVGHAPHIYDEPAAKQLWEISMRMVGLE